MGEYIAELIGFLLVLFVLWRYVVPPVRRMMHNEQGAVRKQVEDSDTATKRLQEAEDKYRSAIEEARTEAAKIRDNARGEAQRIVEEMREQAEREVERIRKRGEEQLQNERLQIVRRLRAYVGELSTSLATEMVSEHLSDNARRSASVDRFLDELDQMSAVDGGQPAGTASKGDA
jgi:F-type H+-transporting ATPase subunit b